jgi:hypothetical protein
MFNQFIIGDKVNPFGQKRFERRNQKLIGLNVSVKSDFIATVIFLSLSG